MVIGWYASLKRAHAMSEKNGKARTIMCMRRISLWNGNRTRFHGFFRKKFSQFVIKTPTAMGQKRSTRYIKGVKKSELMKPFLPNRVRGSISENTERNSP